MYDKMSKGVALSTPHPNNATQGKTMTTTRTQLKPAIIKNLLAGAIITFGLLVTGCASVPLASPEADAAAKQFAPPSDGKASVYIYRNCFVGQALTKTVSIDNRALGKTSNKVFFHTTVTPGSHQLSTESEFGDNTLNFTANAGMSYFFEQYIKMGVFVGGANLKAVSEGEGKANVLKCRLAQ